MLKKPLGDALVIISPRVYPLGTLHGKLGAAMQKPRKLFFLLEPNGTGKLFSSDGVQIDLDCDEATAILSYFKSGSTVATFQNDLIYKNTLKPIQLAHERH